jgi:hypothetical protein
MAKKAARKAKASRTSSKKKAAPKGKKAAARGAGARTGRKTARKTAAAKKSRPKPKAQSLKPKARPKPKAQSLKPKARPKPKAQSPKPRQGGSGRESTLAQTAATGRTVQGRTNPMPTRRSTGTAAGAGDTRRAPGLERERKRLREVEESVQGPPSSLNLDRHGSAARTGRATLAHAKQEHTETSPAMTGGDVDADWEDAYAVGDEAPGGDNPTPDQDRVDDIGRALGIEYADNEELKGADKISDRDKHRWELDPASAEDYPDHDED